MICKVCGLDYGDYTWGKDGQTPSFEICPCCGTTFGYEDATTDGILRKRSDWLEGNGKWFMAKEQPSDWDLETQLKSAGIKR